MPAAKINWTQFETILLDMDGTVLDLAFDNHFWRELIPRCLAVQRGEGLEPVRKELFALYERKQGQLDWYCLDYWSGELNLDLRALKSLSSHRIGYLPGARDFLAEVRQSGKHVVLVTNAHAHTLSVKRAVAGLDLYFDHFVSSHEIGYAKEQPQFWLELQEHVKFVSSATLLVDDSLPVLDAAAHFGIRATVAVRQPDTRKPAQSSGQHRGISGLVDLLSGNGPLA